MVKCFRCPEYREQFNHGTNIYINCLRYFWNVENNFQQDNEGLIFRQHNNGYIIQTHGLEKEITNYHSTDELMNKHPNRVIINGFICCFYLLPKKDVVIDNGLKITNPKEEKDFYYFLNKYYKENNALYASIYNSANFCYIFCNEMREKGYDVYVGGVKYYDLTGK